jgi:uracil-DNA glycosylase
MIEQELVEFLQKKFHSWYIPLKDYLHSKEFLLMGSEVNKRSKQIVMYPKKEHIFKVFEKTDWKNTKVVIIGQEPYCTPLYASGLAFGVSHELINSLSPFPPILEHIANEVEEDVHNGLNFLDYTLEDWSNQGVMLLNAALTVEHGKPGTSLSLWKPFTEHVIKTISDKKPGTIFLLWGSQVAYYKKFINQTANHVIESPGPYPLSIAAKTWNGSTPFSKINKIIEAANGPEFKIKW